MSPLAEALRETIRQIGPCSGLDAWLDLRMRLKFTMHLPGLEQLGGIDPYGVPWIRRNKLDAALIEAERAGGLTCRNLHASGADQIYAWRPVAVLATGPRERQRVLFAASSSPTESDT